MLDLLEPRDAFLSSLCRYALPPRLATRPDASARADAISFAPVDSAYEPLPFTTLSAKNVQALKSLFDLTPTLTLTRTLTLTLPLTLSRRSSRSST